MNQVAEAAGLSVEAGRGRSLELKESNPMFGHRGCRLAISFPEICEMQARAIFEAAAEAAQSAGAAPVPEVMIPLADRQGDLDPEGDHRPGRRRGAGGDRDRRRVQDRKSTRLNSNH